MSRPIGFWLKLVDRLIDERFDRTLSFHRVTRRQWQLLNLLDCGPSTLRRLDAAVAPFLSLGKGESSADHLTDLIERGWVSRQGAMYALTPLGHDELGALSSVVAATRRRTADGISDEEYAATLAVLERMARNLGWDEVMVDQ
jgi:DNA-binding MarR family transcriptional regulator